MKFGKFLLSRFATFLLVIFIGVTTVFFVPRLMPNDPVEAMIGQMTSNAGSMSPEAVEQMRESMNSLFGLDGSVMHQYLDFFKRVVISHDFGPSLSAYPTPVMQMIARALPWTLGLMLTTTVLSWLIGNLIGLLAGFRKDKPLSKFLEGIAILMYPIPYYIFALLLIMFFCYLLPVFPLSYVVQGEGFNWVHIKSILWNCFLPALSLILVGFGWWVISMKTMVSNANEEEYVKFARLKGLHEGRIMRRYVMPNVMLPQVTNLALQIGGIFNGALVTEILFGFPGLGSLIYQGILQSDYNLIMGTITISVISVALTTFVIDLLYPFLDPRIRYS